MQKHTPRGVSDDKKSLILRKKTAENLKVFRRGVLHSELNYHFSELIQLAMRSASARGTWGMGGISVA